MVLPKYQVETRLAKFFVLSAAVLIGFAAAAKLVTSVGHSSILRVSDPIFLVQFRFLFGIVGFLELVVALLCLFSKRVRLQIGLIAFLASNLIAYRLGTLWLGYKKPCGCLGDLTGALGISPNTADSAMKFVLAYLFIGSYALLAWSRWRKRKSAF